VGADNIEFDKGAPPMKTILLLEDLPEIRAWLRKLVLQVFPGATISESSRVHDAIELVGAVKFDLALIDLGLPDGSGVDVVTKLRDMQPDAQSWWSPSTTTTNTCSRRCRPAPLATSSRSRRAS
jgi:CheY-like chemotaxis protein